MVQVLTSDGLYLHGFYAPSEDKSSFTPYPWLWKVIFMKMILFIL